MIPIICRIPWICFALALLPTVAAAQQGGSPKAFVHALIVGDTLAAGIGQSGIVDTKTITAVLHMGIPADQSKITVLKDKAANRETILQYYGSLAVGPNDVLFFYYVGHGGMYLNPKKEHVLTLSSGGQLPRSELRAAMQAKKPALIVLLTDCCNDQNKKARVQKGTSLDEIRVPREQKLLPGFEQLFFKSRGIVDITVADDGNSATGDPLNGGVFTRAFHVTLSTESNDREVTWPRFYAHLKDKASQIHKSIGYTGTTPTTRAFQLPGVTWGFVATEENGHVRVTEVHFLGPAERAGLLESDIVLEVNGTPIKSSADLIAAMSKIQGDRIQLTVREAGSNQVIQRMLKRD